MDVQTSLLGLTRRVDTACAQTLIASEIPLPEGRDAAEVLSVAGTAQADAAVCGFDGVKVSGRLTLYLVCRASSGEAYGFTAQSTFTQLVAAEGAEEGMTAEATAQVLECTASPAGFRLSMNAVLELSLLVAAPVTTPFVTDVSNAPNLEKRRERLTVRRRAQLAEASLRVREELDAKNVARILLYRGTAAVNELRYSGADTCELTGSVYVTALVESEDGALIERLFTLPFETAVAAPYLPTVWASCEIDALSCSAADVSFGLIDVEAALHIVVSGVEAAEQEALLDAYDSEAAFTCETETVRRLSCFGAAQQTFSIQENVRIPQHLPDAEEAIYATVMPVVTGTLERDGMLSLDVMLLLSAVYRGTDGKLHGMTEDIPTELNLTAPYRPEAVARVRLLSAEAGGSGRTLTLSCRLFAEALLYGEEETALVSTLLPGGAPCDCGGVVIYCADAGETLWDVGKRFHVPTEKLAEWNGALPDPLPEGHAVVLLK